MVWQSSQKVGIAYATKLKVKSKTLCTVVVAKFDPPGNDAKSVLDNVDEGSFDRSFCGTISQFHIFFTTKKGNQWKLVRNQ